MKQGWKYAILYAQVEKLISLFYNRILNVFFRFIIINGSLEKYDEQKNKQNYFKMQSFKFAKSGLPAL